MLQDMLDLAEANQAQMVVTGYYIDSYYSENENATRDLADEDNGWKLADEVEDYMSTTDTVNDHIYSLYN